MSGCGLTGGGCGLSESPKQWISLWTAAVDPLPTNKTASFSDAFTAFRMINLDIITMMAHPLHHYDVTHLASSLKNVVCREVAEEVVCVLP